MAFADADIDPKVLLAPTTNSHRADLKTAFNALHTALTTEFITDAGRATTDAAWIDIEQEILALAEKCAVELSDVS